MTLGCAVGLGAEGGGAGAISGLTGGSAAEEREGCRKGGTVPSPWPPPRGVSTAVRSQVFLQRVGTGKYSQMGCTAEDLRNQLPRYWGGRERQKELDWGSCSGFKGRKEVR